LLSTMHVQVCTLDRCCEHQRTHLLHARYRMCICAIYLHVYMYICMCRCVCMHVYILICMYAFTYICVYAWKYIHVYVYVHVHVCIYIYTCILCTHIRIYVCQDLVYLDSLGPPGVSSRLLGSYPSTCAVCVCVCVYTHSHTRTLPNMYVKRRNEILD